MRWTTSTGALRLYALFVLNGRLPRKTPNVGTLTLSPTRLGSTRASQRPAPDAKCRSGWRSPWITSIKIVTAGVIR
jgi:hypothetical protein